MQLTVLDSHPHARECFNIFAKNEEELCGEWAVFYHSYSHSALIYELHAAVAAVLFNFPSMQSTLPRLLTADFAKTPHAQSLITEFQERFTTSLKDHHPDYRAVAISAMCSLVALGPEVSTPIMFLAGFSQVDLEFADVLRKSLALCHIPERKIPKLAEDLIRLSEMFGLDVAHCGGSPYDKERNGHLLQIFIKRSIVDDLVYAAKPFGEVEGTRQPISKWLGSDSNMSFGQARIVVHPKLFMKKNCVRMFLASADPAFHAQRPAFQEELIKLISEALADPKDRHAARDGIYNGSYPEWMLRAQQRKPQRPRRDGKATCAVQ